MLPLFFTALTSTASADDFGTGKGLALGGFAAGIAGNLVSIGGTLSLVPSADPDTGVVDNADARRARPINVVGGSVRRLGGTMMGVGTLQMYGANRRAGAEYSKVPGTLSLAFGIGSLAAFGAGQFLTWPVDNPASARLLTGFALSATSTGLVVASFSLGFTQYIMNNANKPAKRRKIEAAAFQIRLVPHPHGVSLAGTF